jgi:hypothetical protein
MKPVRCPRRAAVATIEALITLGAAMPLAVAMLAFGIRATRAFYHLVATMTCWPYM